MAVTSYALIIQSVKKTIVIHHWEFTGKRISVTKLMVQKNVSVIIPVKRIYPGTPPRRTQA